MPSTRTRHRLYASLLCLASLVALPVSAQAQSGLLKGEATGLIIGLKGDAPAEQVGVGVKSIERARVQWESATRQGREHLTRLVKEAGLPKGTVGEAGNAQLLRFERPLRGDALENAMRRARLHPDVAWVEPDVLIPRLAVPNDPGFPLQWHLQAPGPGTLSGLNLPDAWDQTTGAASIVVAVVDSGILFDHPDLPTRASGRMLQGRDMVSELSIANDGNGRDGDPSDPGDWVSAADVAQPVFRGCDVTDSSWHGTFIAGQVGAITNDASGVAGLNWNSMILPVRVSGKCGARLSDLLDGLRWAAGLPVTGQPTNVYPAKVINLSFGGSRTCAESPSFQSTIDAVSNAGSLVVVASGNADEGLTRPADCRRVMTVASVRRDGAKAEYSNFGSNVALSAPGGSFDAGVPYTDTLLLSTTNSGTMAPNAAGHTWNYNQGTSFAAPQAAGVASLMLSINPSLSPRQLIDRMKAGARPHESLGGLPACGTPGRGVCNCSTTTCGAGLLDAHTSVQLATGPAVVIKPLGTVEPGTAITLDGSRSVPIPGRTIDPASYRWVQVSGPSVTITADRTAVAKATLVTEATYEFSLSIADDQGRTGEDSVVGIAAMPAPPAGSGGGGGGSMGQLWGLSLWAWVLAVAISQRRRLQRRR